jgi:hypothetical protein
MTASATYPGSRAVSIGTWSSRPVRAMTEPSVYRISLAPPGSGSGGTVTVAA